MKKEYSISTFLGARKIEMAKLLKVTRSRWSMYELGKRNLPLAAIELLEKMLNYVQLAKAKASDNLSHLEEQKEETKAELQAALKENQYQQMATSKKTIAIGKKQQRTSASLHLIDYLKNEADKQETHLESMSEQIQKRVNNEIKNNRLTTLITYQIKSKVLQYEAEVLKEALEKLS